MGGKFRPGTLSEMLNRSPPRTFFEVHQIQNLTQFPYDTDFFQKPLDIFENIVYYIAGELVTQ